MAEKCKPKKFDNPEDEPATEELGVADVIRRALFARSYQPLQKLQ